MRAAKVQASLRIRAVSPEPSLLAYTSSESRGTFRQKARSQPPLNGWACAVKICHDGMLEDTNSLEGAQMENIRTTFTVLCREKLTIVNIMFSEMKIHDVKHVDIYKHDNEIQEETIPWITGCDVLEDGNIILCDCENKVIKLLTETFDVKETLTVEDNPWDVSVLNSCDAMITLPWLRKLSILHVDPTLRIGNTVAKFEKKCWGVCVIDSEIYVTLHNEPGEGEVRVVDFKRTQIKRLGVN